MPSSNGSPRTGPRRAISPRASASSSGSRPPSPISLHAFPARVLGLVLVTHLLGSAAAQGAPDPPVPARPAHVVLVSIDGLRPEFYLEPGWPAPVLQQLAASGSVAHAVRPVFPSVTYPNHTTMITGALPVHHGIPYNTPFEPGGQTGRWYWEADAIRVPTLWDAVRGSGGTTASVSWPVSVGAPIDYNVPEVWPLDPAVDRLTPMREATTPAGLFAEIEEQAVGVLSADGSFSGDYPGRDDVVGAMGAYLLETYQPTLTTIHLGAVDHFEHAEGRDGPTVRRAIAAADRAVGRLLEAADRAGIAAETAFIVTGDHGFSDIHTALSPNVWLAEAGLVGTDRDRGADWRAAFLITGASAFLHLRDPADAAALDAARQVLDDLPRGVRSLFTVLDRGDLDRLGAAPEAVLALTPIQGVSFSGSAQGEAVRAASGGTHGYAPTFDEIYTGLIAIGPGVKSGVVIPVARQEDTAAIVAALLGLDFEPPDGVLYPGLLLVP